MGTQTQGQGQTDTQESMQAGPDSDLYNGWVPSGDNGRHREGEVENLKPELSLLLKLLRTKSGFFSSMLMPTHFRHSEVVTDVFTLMQMICNSM